jgi:hypothetical protein
MTPMEIKAITIGVTFLLILLLLAIDDLTHYLYKKREKKRNAET